MSEPQYEVVVSGFWDGLGVDQGGMPVHLPMPLTIDGEGPASGDEVAYYRCWCGRPCPLDVALRESWTAGAKPPILEDYNPDDHYDDGQDERTSKTGE